MVEEADRLIVNGERAPEAEGQTLAAYAAAAGYRLDRVAVEIDGEIVPKDAYGERVLGPGDRVEIVHFMGGG